MLEFKKPAPQLHALFYHLTMDPIKIIRYKKVADTWHFKVAVGYPDDQTMHHVSLHEDYYQKLTDGQVAADQLVITSFKFLLERESKESILPTFDLSLIATYFPEYEQQFKS